MNSSLAPAFTDPVLDAQSVFRSVMAAMARPGRVQFLDSELSPPAPLSPGAAAIALALFDYETPVWLDGPLSGAGEVAQWLRFHTGAPIAGDPAQAAFALIAGAKELPELQTFALGLPDYPDRSTTLIVQVESLSSGRALSLTGPGIDGTQDLLVEPLPGDFAQRMIANRSLFPRGVDLLLVTDYALAAIPRSAHITEEG